MGKRTEKRILTILGFAPGRWFRGFELHDAGISPTFLYPALTKLRDKRLIEHRSEPDPLNSGAVAAYYRIPRDVDDRPAATKATTAKTAVKKAAAKRAPRARKARKKS